MATDRITILYIHYLRVRKGFRRDFVAFSRLRNKPPESSAVFR